VNANWALFVLGRFSGLAAIPPGHTLVTGNVHSVICHPSYLGLLVNSLGSIRRMGAKHAVGRQSITTDNRFWPTMAAGISVD